MSAFSALLLQVTRADVARMLRADALSFGLGVLLLAGGFAALAVHLRASSRREPSLPWLGLFAGLYGLRLLAGTETFRLLFEPPAAFWRRLGAAITYAILIPPLLFLRAAFPAWRRSMNGALLLLVAFAVGAVAADAILGRAYSALTANNVITIPFLVTALALLFRPGSSANGERRLLRLGVVGFALTAVVDNLRGLGMLAWPRFTLEPVGATLLIACLGAMAVRRLFQGAERLSALDRELSIARRIQSSILPSSTPSMDGLTVAARYRPMSAVAGDFYEFLPAGGRRLGVLIADVSGHGVPAALIASMVKIAIAAQKPHAERPAAVLAGMNETLAGQLGGQYVTAAYLFLDREKGLMRYSAAGHPPLLRWPAGGTQMQEIEKNGVPLGLMEQTDYEELEEPLQQGDRFLLYTDGLVDATDARGDFFGLERVKAVVASGSGRSTESAAEAIAEEVRRWAHGAAADDLTVVLVDCV